MKISKRQLRRIIREHLLSEYVTGIEDQDNALKANEKQRQDILDMLSDFDDTDEVGELLDVVAGADRLAKTEPKHDRYFTSDDISHVVTALEAGEDEEIAGDLEDFDFSEYLPL